MLTRYSLSEIVDVAQDGNLKTWRVKRGLSRLRIGKLLGMSEKAIRRVETNGRMTKRMCEAVIALYLKDDKTPTKTPRNEIVNNWYSALSN